MYFYKKDMSALGFTNSKEEHILPKEELLETRILSKSMSLKLLSRYKKNQLTFKILELFLQLFPGLVKPVEHLKTCNFTRCVFHNDGYIIEAHLHFCISILIH